MAEKSAPQNDLGDDKFLLTGVNVLTNAPDPRLCNKNINAIQTDEEKKALENMPTVAELNAKKKAAQKKARSIHDDAAFSTYIFRVLKQVSAECEDGQQIGIS